MGDREQTATNSPIAAIDFKRNHPEAYGLLARTALDMRRRGSRVSAARIFEAVRVEQLREPNAVPFKLNNSLRPAVARLLMADYPELEGAFETRRAASDGYDFKSAQKDNNKVYELQETANGTANEEAAE